MRRGIGSLCPLQFIQYIWSRWLLETQLVETRTSGSQGHPFSLPLSLSVPSSPSGDQTTCLHSYPGWTANRRGDRQVNWVCAGPQPNNSICYGGWSSHDVPFQLLRMLLVFLTNIKSLHWLVLKKGNRLENIYTFLLADCEKTELPVWLQKGNIPQRKQYCREGNPLPLVQFYQAKLQALSTAVIQVLFLHGFASSLIPLVTS